MEKEEAVWQRVLAGAAEQPRNDLKGLRLTAMELAAMYRALAGRSSGKQRERLQQLLEGELKNLAALKGLARLSGQKEEVLKVWNPGKEVGRKVLERCYYRTRRCMADYMSRSAEPEFGVVFRALADREGLHCALIAELLGE